MSLPNLEIKSYFVLWIGGIVYSVYNVYKASQLYHPYFFEDDLAPGWLWLSTYIDNSDSEWKMWLPFMWQHFPWILLHLIGAELSRWLFSETVEKIWYALVSITFLNYVLGFPAAAMLTLHPILMIFLFKIGGIAAVWLFSLISIVSLNFITIETMLENDMVLFHMGLCWLQLRCVSFCIDKGDKVAVERNLNLYIDILSYCLYLPVLFLGPFIPYSTFSDRDSDLATFASFLKRSTQLVMDTCRYLFWMLFTNISLHFLYYNALQLNVQVLEKLDAWTTNGVVFCAGLFFCIKYIICYGLAGGITKADGRSPPPTPRCVARVSLYSALWRHFDRGYYVFLQRYVYGPLLQKGLSRLVCSGLSFLFVFVWHGATFWIFIWAAYNFLGVTLEAVAQVIVSHPRYQKWEKMLSPNGVIRWRALAACPLFIMSAYTNFYFFGGTGTAHVLLSQLWRGSISRLVCFIFFGYCCCQVSNEVDRWKWPEKKWPEKGRVDAIHKKVL